MKSYFFFLPACLLVMLAITACAGGEQEPLKVGILHSLSGTMAASESPVADATMMAVDEINEAGGIMGRQLEPVIVDSRSDAKYAAQQAARLINEENVAVIFGCWTSACRKTVRPVIEEHDSLLVYPVQFEGLEESPNIIYTGSTPNQQIIPAIDWAFFNLGHSFFLVGSDYVFPRAANEIIKDKVARLGGEIVGEEYILLGSQNVDEVVAKISAIKPDVILNTINGDTNIAFFQALHEAGLSADNMPTVSFSLAEAELQDMDVENIAGTYAAWSYFQSVDSNKNNEFVQDFQDRYGSDRVTTDPIEAGYLGVYLWANAVNEAGSIHTQEVTENIAGQTFSAPQGFVRVDAENQHLWKAIRIGQIRRDSQFDIVWDPGTLMSPRPFPKSRSAADWLAMLEDLYLMWDGSWESQAE